MYFPEAGALRPPAPPCTFFSVSASVFHRAGGRLLPFSRRTSHPPRPAVRACTTSSSSVAVHLTLRYCLNQQPHLVLALRSAFRWFGFMASWNPMWRGPGALLPHLACGRSSDLGLTSKLFGVRVFGSPRCGPRGVLLYVNERCARLPNGDWML